MSVNPVLVEVVRGETVESFHRGAACIADAAGSVIAAWGDVDHAICPRSAIKPFQALPLLESGAADAFQVSAEELALACASHSGEPEHVRRVAAWLSRIGLNVNDLECGAHPPTSTLAADALICERVPPTALHNNCSGKHTGFLTLARYLGVATNRYTGTAHPVQQTVLAALSEITGAALGPVVRDGCSAPNTFLPLRALATGFARLADPKALPGPRAAAIRRIVAAMKAHPVLMSGHGRPCAKLITALAGNGIVKTGAEGVFAAALPEQGIGIAVKIDDGAGRAAVVAITALLAARRAFRADAGDVVQSLKAPVLTAWAGGRTGVIRPATTWQL